MSVLRFNQVEGNQFVVVVTRGRLELGILQKRGRNWVFVPSAGRWALTTVDLTIIANYPKSC